MNFEELDDIYYDNLADDSQIEYCLTLLTTSSVSYEERIKLENELSTFELMNERVNEIKMYLLNSQVDRINGGFNYNQTDITRKINREIWKQNT